MRFVGVRNSPEKRAALERPPLRIERVAPDELAYDCVRHLELLRTATPASGDDELRRSLYCRFLRAGGRDDAAALAKARAFLALHARIRDEGMDYAYGRVAVTEDGIRLNGSHRAAIAAALGLERVDVEVHPWPRPARRTRHVRLEAELKREGQEAWLGRSVAGGTVAFVDARVATRPWWLPGAPSGELLLVVDDGAELTSVPAAAAARA